MAPRIQLEPPFPEQMPADQRGAGIAAVSAVAALAKTSAVSHTTHRPN
jgi:hypothetical protein